MSDTNLGSQVDTIPTVTVTPNTTQPPGIEGDRFAAGGGLTLRAPVDQPKEQPSSYEDIAAAALRATDVASAFAYLGRPAFKPDPTYNPINDPQVKGSIYEQYYLDNFVGSQSASESGDIIRRISKELGDQSILARGGISGTVAGFASGMLSPFMLVPFGGEVKALAGAGKAVNVLARAGKTAALVGAAVAGQEAVLGATRETWTPAEAAFAIGGSALLGGVLGGAAAGLSRGHLNALGEGLASIPASDEAVAALTHEALQPAGVGAQVSSAEFGPGIVRGALGAEKLTAFQDPLSRTLQSPFREARLANRQLNEIPVALEDNALGIPTSLGGSAEYLAHEYDYPLADSMAGMERAFSDYRFGAPDVRFGRLRAGFADLTGQAGGKMGFADFKAAVFDAMHSGDLHPVPEVARAAQEIRAKVEDPLKAEAIKVGLFPEDVKPGDDVSHVFRVWDTKAVAADRGGLAEILTRDFSERQGEILARLNELDGKLTAEGKPVPLSKEDVALRQFAEASPGEIRSAAEDSVNTILGFSPERAMLPRDIAVGVRGPLKERLLRITTAKVRDYVVRDIAHVQRMAVRTMATDIALLKKFGSLDLSSEIAKINDEAANLIRANPGSSARVTAAQKTAIRDLGAMVERMRGLYGIPKNPDGLLHRAVRVTLNWNLLAKLGNVVVSSIADIGKPVMNYGLNQVMATAFHPLVRGTATIKLAMKEARLANAALDLSNHARQMSINDIMDNYGRGNRFEKGVQWATDRFGSYSLMDAWNQFHKEFAGTIAQTKMLQAIERAAAGKATNKEIGFLAADSIDANLIERIGKQFAAHGVKDGEVWWAATEHWTDPQAVLAMRAALHREINRTIVTPGQDKPLWMSSELGRVIGQFHSFNIASVQRTIVAGLQQRDAAALNGAMLMLGLGYLSGYLKSTLAGYDVSKDNMQTAALNAFDNSGLAGWIMDANNVATKLSVGAASLQRLVQAKEPSRYQSQDVFALFGPTATTMEAVAGLVGAVGHGNWTQSTTHKVRGLIPLQNLFYLRWLFSKAEAGINSAFGIRKAA